MTLRAVFVFTPFRLDTANEQLWRGSNLLTLRPKTYEVLLYLVQNSQRLVTKLELLEKVWPDAVVSDELLRGYIRELREALGDDAKKPKYIETVQARGYRFLLRVELEPPPLPLSPRTQELPARKKAAKTQKELRVGILLSLTGTMAWTESPMVDAILLGIENINAEGGILGREIRPVVADGESDEAAFVQPGKKVDRT
ncbi:MAG TPA: winged helix-turn-helix domain-containing protein [Candidatus Acidoferrum sp.]|nr:winged helix-turn-helix domain-containing protein [Candidatus Acidoferrum sp.]